ncbi:MAG: hypothetical protein R2854_11835 [Caldilineaceae bacterium]
MFGAGTIPIIYLIGKRMSGVSMDWRKGRLPGLFAVQYLLRMKRMYTLLAFNAVVAIYALVRLLTDARAVTPVGSQVRNYIHIWRTAAGRNGSASSSATGMQVRAQSGWRAYSATGGCPWTQLRPTWPG